MAMVPRCRAEGGGGAPRSATERLAKWDTYWVRRLPCATRPADSWQCELLERGLYRRTTPPGPFRAQPPVPRHLESRPEICTPSPGLASGICPGPRPSNISRARRTSASSLGPSSPAPSQPTRCSIAHGTWNNNLTGASSPSIPANV